MSRSNLINSPITRYLDNFRRYYPGILEWYSGLEPGFASGERRMFVSWNGSNVDGLAITKNKQRAKLCHISVSTGARNRGIGSTLAQLALCDIVRNGAHEIRLTTSEEVFRGHASFFGILGFRVIDWQVNRYRRGVSELLWNLKVDPDSPEFEKNLPAIPHYRIDVFGVALETLPLGRHANVNAIDSSH